MAHVIPIKAHREYERKNKRSAAGVLRDARTRNPTEVLVIGLEPDGTLFCTGSPPDPGNALWLMEAARNKLMGK